MGDYIYEYSYRNRPNDLVRRHDKATDALTLADYRNRYALYKTDPDLQAVHQASACLVTWDDHELHNDYADKLSAYEGVTGATLGTARGRLPGLLRAHAAAPAFDPARRSPSTVRPPSLRIAGGVQLRRWTPVPLQAGLPGRQTTGAATWRRSPAPIGPTPLAPTLAANRRPGCTTVSGARTRAWNIIGQPTQFTPYLQKNADGSILGEYTESWASAGMSRQRLTDALVGSKLRNPVFFGGDIHCFVAAEISSRF